ncbi:NAD(P)-dependent oxidoreductase [Candidatus Woesearchaeota archaeon]|nr:NAD(P)-dependent oxidoreductase [Candidatus Woesearchaeota archaeon]
MRIAILGATSQIAQDLLLSFSRHKSYEFSLYGRNVELLEEWINIVNLDKKYQIQEYSNFNNNQKYDLIINFVGIGDPAKVQEMGNNIFKITEQYDEMVLEYLKCNKETKYIFLSSGAVYGGDYEKPVNENTVAMIDINNLGPTNWYTIAKLYAEAKHRSLSDLPIVDVRVFNYFSHTQDMSASFLITDIIHAIKNKEVFKTSSENIARDFITPPDFYNLIRTIIDFKPINIALDCYTKSPVLKFDLLSEFGSKFGLKYEVDKDIDIVNATGAKLNYYSTNKIAKNMGYTPTNTSIDGVIQEIVSLEL